MRGCDGGAAARTCAGGGDGERILTSGSAGGSAFALPLLRMGGSDAAGKCTSTASIFGTGGWTGGGLRRGLGLFFFTEASRARGTLGDRSRLRGDDGRGSALTGNGRGRDLLTDLSRFIEACRGGGGVIERLRGGVSLRRLRSRRRGLALRRGEPPLRGGIHVSPREVRGGGVAGLQVSTGRSFRRGALVSRRDGTYVSKTRLLRDRTGDRGLVVME